MNRFPIRVLALFNSVKEKGFYHLLSANYLIRFLGFASQLIVAWIITTEDVGRIKVMQSYMSVFVVLASFGFNVSILKLCSEDRSEKQKNYLFRKGLTYSLVSQILTIALIFFLVYFELLSQDFIINKVFLVYALGLAPLVLDGIILGEFEKFVP